MMPCYHSGSPPLAGKASAGTPLARDTLAGYRPPMPSGAQKPKAVHSRKAPGPCSARLSRSLSANGSSLWRKEEAYSPRHRHRYDLP